jgi:hypothetical protein
MKLKRPYLFLLMAVIFIQSCDSEDSDPISVELQPDRIEQLDYTRELVFNSQEQLIQIISTSEMPNDVKLISIQEFSYGTDGRLNESTTDSGWRLVYQYEGDLIVRTDEYINDVLSQYHTFQYNSNGTLAERLTWQDIPEEGGLIPVSKDAFEYDAHNNVIKNELFYYNSGSKQHELLTRFVFSDYDNKMNSEELFYNNPFNPFIKLRENNPGKMVVANKNGVVSSTDTYTYQFNDQGYAIQKTTNTLFHHGGTGSYETKYFFEPK